MKSGFLAVNKPPGITSHSVIDLARRLLQIKKIGHAGTLDVPASGVLVLGIGRATRLLKYVTAMRKKYTAELLLGKSTETGDNTGKITAEKEVGKISQKDLKLAVRKFTGRISQIPPMYSAKKIEGRRLHILARKGETVLRQPHTVNIYSLELDWQERELSILKLVVECSSGTYIRTLGEDIAKELGELGHIKNLCRLTTGSFSLSDCFDISGGVDALAANSDLDRAEAAQRAKKAMVSMADAMRDYPQYQVSGPEQEKDIREGRKINMRSNSGTDLPKAPIMLLDGGGELLAVCEADGFELQPRVVVAD